MQVHYDEGVAIHIGPEPCAVIREDVGEASAGEHAGQPLSRERTHPGMPTPFTRGRQHGGARQRECPPDPAWSETLACMDALCTGTGRSRVGHRPHGQVVRSGKARSRSRRCTTWRSLTSP